IRPDPRGTVPTPVCIRSHCVGTIRASYGACNTIHFRLEKSQSPNTRVTTTRDTCSSRGRGTPPVTPAGTTPARLRRFGVTRLPLLPRDVPVAEPLGAGQRPAGGVLDDHQIPAAEVVVKPFGVGRADIQAPVRGVG